VIFLDFVKMIIGMMVNHHNQDFFDVIFLDFMKVTFGTRVNHHNQDFLKVIFLDFVKVFFGTNAPEILLVSMTWENRPLLPAVFD